MIKYKTVVLTDIQKKFLTRVCLLLIIQLFIMIGIVLGLHKINPDKKCIFTCNPWIDIILFLVIEILLLLGLFLFRDYSSPTQFMIRCLFFITFGSLLSYIIAIQYNIMMDISKDKEQTQQNFFISISITLGIFVIVLLTLPFLMQYTKIMYSVMGVLLFFLLILLIWTIFFSITYVYLILALILFIVFLFVDLNILTYECKKPNTVQCDPPTGASQIFIDLVNIIQKLFMLLDFKR